MNDQERIAMMNKIIYSNGEALKEIELNKAERKVFDEVSSFYRILISGHIEDKNNLFRHIRHLESKIASQRKELRRLHEENMDLKEENSTLKEVRIFNKSTIELLLKRLNETYETDYVKAMEEHFEETEKVIERE